MEAIFMGIIVGLMFVTALLGNFLVMYTVYRNTLLRQQCSSIFVVNLAVCDFLIALLLMPGFFGVLINRSWLAESFFCQLNGFLNHLLGICAIHALVLISIDRFYAVMKPLKYRAKMTMQKSLYAVFYVWIQAIIFALVPVPQGWYQFNDSFLCCTFTPSSHHAPKHLYIYSLYFFNFVIPLVIMLAAYYKIFHVAKRHSGRIGPAVVQLGAIGIQELVAIRKDIGRQREARAARNITFVVAAFLCCHVPYITLKLLQLQNGFTLQLPLAATISVKLLNFLKSSLDPIIYGLCQRKFRSAFSSILPSGIRVRIMNKTHLNQEFVRRRASNNAMTSADRENSKYSEYSQDQTTNDNI